MRTFRTLQAAAARPTLRITNTHARASSVRSLPSQHFASPASCRTPAQTRCFSHSRARRQQWEWPEDHPNHPNNRGRTNTGKPSGSTRRDDNKTYWYIYDSSNKGRVRLDPHEELRRAEPLLTTSRIGRVARAPSTKTIAALAVAGAFAFYFANMQTVPVSGRRRFNCFSQESVEKVAEEQVKRIIYDVERQGGRFLSDWDWRVQMVKRVMKRLIPVSGMEDAQWEIRVIDDPGQSL